MSAASRSLDLICLGRAAVDLYGEQIGARLEDQSSFAKYLGGCPANIAVGASRLGLRVAMLTRVGDEQNGSFVRETLAAEGVDVSRVKTDAERLTALVFLSVKDRSTFPLIFYRHECADMAVSVEDLDAAFIGSAKALLVSGTHFSRPGPAATCEQAIRMARAQGLRVVFDIDYRPVLWGLTPPGRGEERFVKSAAVTRKMQEIVALCDLVIGTEEEFHVAAGCENTGDAVRRLREQSGATFVVKRGPLGCTVHHHDRVIEHRGFPVEVFNVLGAGDGFAAGFLSGWLDELPLEECARRANACGALVVSRHGCAPAMPSKEELALFLSREDWPRRLRESALLAHVHRATTGRKPPPEVLALAFDHRMQLEALGTREQIIAFKGLVAEGLKQAAGGLSGVGAIVDDRYGEEALFALTGSGVWLARPVEAPGRERLEFEAGDNVGVALRGWPSEHVVKCLCHYTDADLPRLRQLHEACAATGHELLLEVIAKDLPAALERIYASGIKPQWWKLASPETPAAWEQLTRLIQASDPYCRGVVLLGMEASEQQLGRSFALAARYPVCKGFAVGRSIFMEPARRWFAGRCGDAEVVSAVKQNYLALVDIWRKARRQCRESDSLASV